MYLGVDVDVDDANIVVYGVVLNFFLSNLFLLIFDFICYENGWIKWKEEISLKEIRLKINFVSFLSFVLKPYVIQNQ